MQKSIFASACVVVLSLLQPKSTGANDWLPARGVVAAQSGDSAAFQAERQALARALARYLQNWLSEKEIESEAKTMNDWFFASPRSYVDAVSSVTITRSGIQTIWQGLAKFNEDRVVFKLRELGLINSWDRDPRLVLQLAPSLAAWPLTMQAWYRDLSASGIQLITVNDNEAHGSLRVELDELKAPHPLAPNQTYAVTDIVLDGQLGEQRFVVRIPFLPSDRAAMTPLFTAVAIQRIYQAWLPSYFAARNQRLWQAGEFSFTSIEQWLAFDQKLMNNRALLHDVYPHRVRRDTAGWHITYRFFLNSQEVAAAEKWLAQLGPPIKRTDQQSFVVELPKP